MTIKPWREVAHPHKDVLEGTFKQSEFAADISQVHAGTAPPEYQDAEKFFSRTFITEGMRLLLQSVAERLSGGVATLSFSCKRPLVAARRTRCWRCTT
jgi:predicted AAA+ superfamily ATPase